jgi:hypothetical protein
MSEIYFIGPESRVYHTHRDCPLLNNQYRYHNIQTAPEPTLGRHLCKRCAKKDQE